MVLWMWYKTTNLTTSFKTKVYSPFLRKILFHSKKNNLDSLLAANHVLPLRCVVTRSQPQKVEGATKSILNTFISFKFIQVIGNLYNVHSIVIYKTIKKTIIKESLPNKKVSTGLKATQCKLSVSQDNVLIGSLRDSSHKWQTSPHVAKMSPF